MYGINCFIKFHEKNYIMIAQILKEAFDKYFDLPIETWIGFEKDCVTINFDKEEIIKHEDTTEKYFYFILKGSAGIFLRRKNNLVCLDIAFENNFFCDYMSLLTRKSSPLQTMTIEKSEMLKMTNENSKLLGHFTFKSVIFHFDF